MKLLDCTLRDGGYYTSWNFSRKLVDEYLNVMSAVGVDVVELGLRNFPKDEFLGASAYTTDAYLRSLNLPDDLVIGVMVDAKTLLTYPGGVKEGIAELFGEANGSPVELVRVAAHFTEVANCEEIVSQLKSLGYIVGFNLMQSGGKHCDAISNAGAIIAAWNCVDVLYFADSMGNMDEAEVARIYQALSKTWSKEIGIHTHNNQGRALENSLIAKEIGVSWVDSTVLGMGRGAGNAATELLTLELEAKGEKYQSKPLWSLVIDQFQPMQKKYGWGASLLYHYAAVHNIHPTYVQSLLAEGRYTSDQIIQALGYIAPLETSSFNHDLLSSGVNPLTADLMTEGAWDAHGWCQNQELVILGAGQSLSDYAAEVADFIRARGALTLSLNVHNEIDSDLIDAYVAIDPMRLMLEVNNYERLGKPVFTSVDQLPEDIKGRLERLNIRDYGYQVDAGVFDAEPKSCRIPDLLSLAYAFALAKIGNAERIWLVGFDGYGGGDRRQEEMIHTLGVIKPSGVLDNAICITPTTYPMRQGYPSFVQYSEQDDDLNELFSSVHVLLTPSSTLGFQASLLGATLVTIDVSVLSPTMPYAEMGFSIGLKSPEDIEPTLMRLSQSMTNRKPEYTEKNAAGRVAGEVMSLLNN
jgi:4-hydroxy 2-oxovalerate aldolase